MAKKDFRTSVALDETQHKSLQKMAKELDVSVGWVIRKALEEYIRNNNDQFDLFLDIEN